MCGWGRGLAQETLPVALRKYIHSITVTQLPDASISISCSQIGRGAYRVAVTAQLKRPVQSDRWAVAIRPDFQPVFHWAPLLTQDSNHVIAQHVFRAPALVAADSAHVLTIIPDLDLLSKGSPVPWYLDLDAPDNLLEIGMTKTKVKEHVLYESIPGAVFPAGKLELAFYCLVDDKKEQIFNPWHAALNFMWERWARPLYQSGAPLYKTDLEPYVKQTYDWAFSNWKKAVWQEFELKGRKVGAPVFIVNTTQSPNYPGQVNQREFLSIWNQAWFNSLRSAQGLYRYARSTGNDTLKQYALKTKELALAFEQKEGFFKSVVATEMETLEQNGQQYHRSRGWNTLYFGNSNRNPYTWDARQSPYHIADMSFTAYWMLVWYKELEKDSRLLDYAERYARSLVQIQDAEGFFPAWLQLDNLQPMQHLNQSPETSISVSFLIKLYHLTRNSKYLQAAKRAMDAVIRINIPVGQWEDFETYWSCSRVGAEDWVGKKVKRNNMYKQNNFCIYWTAEALLEVYQATGDSAYLLWGQRVLDELLMYQATWQPPYIAVSSLGGFGVMNGDAEWNDSRQSLFAELIIRYGMTLKDKTYLERGLAAIRAAFTMMYTPLNPRTMEQWQARWPFFGPRDYGFMMENYGHGGVTNAQGLGIGDFTIYDWGNGAAAEAFSRLRDHYGKAFINGNLPDF
ncbi:hypothetical protein GCM10027051_26420 [Niabella terrae]